MDLIFGSSFVRSCFPSTCFDRDVWIEIDASCVLEPFFQSCFVGCLFWILSFGSLSLDLSFGYCFFPRRRFVLDVFFWSLRLWILFVGSCLDLGFTDLVV